MSYEVFLDRALSNIETIEKVDRISIKPKVDQAGKSTILNNLRDIATTLNRDPRHLTKFLLHELGTAGKIKGSGVIFKGKFSTDSIYSAIHRYMDKYVTCSECERLDTHLVKSNRILMLKCDACGALRSVDEIIK